ncbi:MAG TPA: hypothetical protein VL361_02760 [Candidatus Limnocylindrales bacterium]|jgi:hypothetical protein|nr:hypothetical protein [Candidatus Limnocylindrales bacterium]
MRLQSITLIVAGVLAGHNVVAQQSSAASQASLVEIHINKVKPGMTRQYEEGRKKHMMWHRQHNDAWSWYTWEIVTGENTGSYVVGTFGHKWSDLDGRTKFVEEDGVDAIAKMGHTLESEMQSYYLLRSDLTVSAPSSEAAPLASVTHFLLAPDGVNDFVEGVKKVSEGIKKTNYPMAGANRWYQLLNGGDSPHFVLVGDRANWAAFQPPTEKSLDAMMEEAYGKEQGAAILATLRKTFRRVTTEALRYRPELSYVAEQK